MSSSRPVREEQRLSWDWGAIRPGGALVPVQVAGRVVPVPGIITRHARAVRTAARVAVALGLLTLLLVHVQPSMALSPPLVPASEQVCGSASLNGPSSAPGGAVTVPAGDNSAQLTGSTLPADTTYWFASGDHTIGTGEFSQIQPGNGDVFTGAPGAVLDGQGLNNYAITSFSTNVTVEYLTIENFIPQGSAGAVNQAGAPDWTVEYNTIEDNAPGAALMVGTGNVVTGNCLTLNGEYGFNGYTVTDVSPVTGGPSGIVMTGNEISHNDTCNWENSAPWPYGSYPAACSGITRFAGCGCSGAGKFWETDQGTFTNNYVHDNYNYGPWWDTNNIGWLVSGNYIANNWGTGLDWEISYNADITGNIFVGNDVAGYPAAPGFPASAIFISASGSDPRVPGAYSTQFLITGNQFYDNWGGVVLFENADRFCSSIANTSAAECTLVNTADATLQTCNVDGVAVSPLPPASGPPAPAGRKTLPRRGTAQGQGFVRLLFGTPYFSDCRWKTQNVQVSGNLFEFSTADLGVNCTTGNLCGFNGVFSQYGSIGPYVGYIVPQAVTFTQDNLFAGNTYCGPWQYDAYLQGDVFNFATWQGTYAQDPGSTLNGPACTAAPYQQPRAPVHRVITIPIRTG